MLVTPSLAAGKEASDGDQELGVIMASVSFRPGDTLNIVWSALHQTPLGVQEIESSFSFSYGELLERLRGGSVGRSRHSGTEGARFSRVVALATNAIRKGHWSTGASIDRSRVFSRMMAQYGELDKREHANITANARRSLVRLYKNSASSLSNQQRRDLRNMLDTIGA